MILEFISLWYFCEGRFECFLKVICLMSLFKQAHVLSLSTVFVFVICSYQVTQLTGLFFLSLWQCSAIWTQSTGMVLSDEDGPEKEITPVRQTSPPPPHNNPGCTTMAAPPLPSWFPTTLFHFLRPNPHSTASTPLLSSQHGNPLPVEAVLPEAGLLPGQFRLHLGDDAAALHHSAKSQPREQRCAEAANPGPQQALHQGSGWGEPECHGWALCGHHDGLRWVTLQKGL